MTAPLFEKKGVTENEKLSVNIDPWIRPLIGSGAEPATCTAIFDDNLQHFMCSEVITNFRCQLAPPFLCKMKPALFEKSR